jgi:FkbM family methyltransferase
LNVADPRSHPTPPGSADWLQVQRHGRSFKVRATHPEFWRDFDRDEWEWETFALFDHFIRPDTVYLDVGAWIGPTLLYGASRAKQAIGFEPDPVAFGILQQNVAANANLAPTEVHPFAISAERGRLRFGSQSKPGDSMSSALFAGGAQTWEVEARRLEDFEGDWPKGARVFLKIDIEGGEYALLPALRDFIQRHRPTIYLSLHSNFMMAPYANRGGWSRRRGEFNLFRKFLRCHPVLRSFPYVTTLAGQRLSSSDLWRRRTWLHAYALVLSHEPIPALRRSK